MSPSALLPDEFCDCQLESAEQYFSDEAVLHVLRVTMVLGYVLVMSWCAFLWRQRWSIMLLVKSYCDMVAVWRHFTRRGGAEG